MIKWGIYLLIFGVGTFILDAMGMQFKVMAIFGENQMTVAAVLALAGGALVAAGLVRKYGAGTAAAGTEGNDGAAPDSPAASDAETPSADGKRPE